MRFYPFALPQTAPGVFEAVSPDYSLYIDRFVIPDPYSIGVVGIWFGDGENELVSTAPAELFSTMANHIVWSNNGRIAPKTKIKVELTCPSPGGAEAIALVFTKSPRNLLVL